jgi:uncharacterized membrane protein
MRMPGMKFGVAVIIVSVIVAIATHDWWFNHFNGGVVLFLITTVPLIAFVFLWTMSIYRTGEKMRRDYIKKHKRTKQHQYLGRK